MITPWPLTTQAICYYPRTHVQGVKESAMSSSSWTQKLPNLEFWAPEQVVSTTNMLNVAKKLASLYLESSGTAYKHRK